MRTWLTRANVFTFSIVDLDGNNQIDVDGMGYRPSRFSALILKKLKNARSEPGREVRQAASRCRVIHEPQRATRRWKRPKWPASKVLRLGTRRAAARWRLKRLGARRGGDRSRFTHFGGGNPILARS
jgi:hypothetical protein